MIEKIEDLNLDGVARDKENFEPQVNERIKEKLGLSIEDCKKALSEFVATNPTTIANNFKNIAPYGDYAKFMEDPTDIKKFIVDELHKVENWNLKKVEITEVAKDLIAFEFENKAVDDGDAFEGLVYSSFQGKIKRISVRGD